jgi:archaellum biogenesis protein FlaJ (TadC family)
MKAPSSVPGRRRDPFWDMEGRGVRRDRRMRKVLKILVLLAIVVLMVVVVRPMAIRALAAYPDIDAWVGAVVVTVSDPFKIAGAILLGASVATAVMYVRRVRRVRAVRR